MTHPGLVACCQWDFRDPRGSDVCWCRMKGWPATDGVLLTSCIQDPGSVNTAKVTHMKMLNWEKHFLILQEWSQPLLYLLLRSTWWFQRKGLGHFNSDIIGPSLWCQEKYFFKCMGSSYYKCVRSHEKPKSLFCTEVLANAEVPSHGVTVSLPCDM